MAVAVKQKRVRRKDPNGARIFAVGDIHGCYDALLQIITKIENYERAENDTVVFLGDYVDKGPDSKKVLDFLMHYQAEDPEHVKVLMGNHDFHFATFGKNWIKKNWGRITLESYIDKNTTKYYMGKSFQNYDAKKIAEHRAFIKSMPYYWETKHFLFVHAGIDPEKEMWEQSPKTMLFIREKFLKGEIDSGHKYIVHGHHKLEDGKVRFGKNRINVDTACYATGVLSCVVLDAEKGEPIEVLQTKVK